MLPLPLPIEELLRRRLVEGARVEMKATWSDPTREQLRRTLCAFANDLENMNGGYIVLGVEEVGGHAVLDPLKGLDGDPPDLDLIQKQIVGDCTHITPPYQPTLFPVEVQGRWLLVVFAPAGDARPYQAPDSLKQGTLRYYVRVGSITRKAEGELLTQLLAQTNKVPFDDRRAMLARESDVSVSLVRSHLRDIRSALVSDDIDPGDHELLLHLLLIQRVNGHFVPRNVALLFFSEDPRRWFPGAAIEISIFGDDDGGDLIEDHPLLRGPIQRQLRLALDLLSAQSTRLIRKVPGAAVAEHADAWPHAALEEALVNAVYHRGYDDPNPIKIRSYPDRLEITSYPGPVPGLQSRDLEEGQRVGPVPPRNRRIGEFLKELRLAEARGTGIPKIRRQMARNGSPPPRFDFDPARTWFRVTLPAHPAHLARIAITEAAYLRAIGQEQDAYAHLKRAAISAPAAAPLIGELLREADRRDDAETAWATFQAYESATAGEVHPHVLRAMVDALVNHEQTAKALSLLQRFPRQADRAARLHLAAQLCRQEDWTNAHIILDEEDRAAPLDPAHLCDLGTCKLRLAALADPTAQRRLHTEAISCFRRAIAQSIDPVLLAWASHDLAWALSELGAPVSEVRSAYTRALELLPADPALAVSVGRLRDRQR
jgi:ATP-dependent DNA helicase RecG